MTELRTRRPTGAAPWMRVLLTSEDGVDPGFLAAEATADPRLVTSYWLDVTEGGTGDVYAAVPGADYELLDHDGTWADIYGQLCAAWDLAREVAESGELPSALVVHGMSNVWKMLCAYGDRLSRRRAAAYLVREGHDPAGAYSGETRVKILEDVWALVNARHSRFMAKILTWPGPVVLTAREDRGHDGVWDLKAQPGLGWDVTAWVRLTRDEQPEIIALNTPSHGRLAPSQRAHLRAEFTIERLLWEWSGCSTRTPVPAVRPLTADQVMPDEEPPVRAVRAVASKPSPPRPASSPEPPPGDEALPPDAEIIAHQFDAFMKVSDEAKIPPLWDRLRVVKNVAEAADVSAWLTSEEREKFGVTDKARFTLWELATEATRHLMDTGTPMRESHDEVSAA